MEIKDKGQAPKKKTTTSKKTSTKKPAAKKAAKPQPEKIDLEKPIEEIKPSLEKTVGAGDVIEKVTSATGIKKLVEVFTPEGEDCGCDERKMKFNNTRLKYGGKMKIARCPSKHELAELQDIFERSKTKLTQDDAKRIAEIYSQVFATRFEIWCGFCGGIWRTKISHLKAVIDFYTKEQEDVEKAK